VSIENPDTGEITFTVEWEEPAKKSSENKLAFAWYKQLKRNYLEIIQSLRKHIEDNSIS